MKITPALVADVKKRIRRARLIETATRLISVPSKTGEAGAVADCLGEMLGQDGFPVERPEGGHPSAPAVASRHLAKTLGRTLQFDGHLDTVHLPFVPPQVNGDKITGSGASDMKSGVAVAVEALRVLREADFLPAGAILFTAHDLHEAPWGLGQQLDRLIQDGYVGDAVLLPEPLCTHLPVIGRGAAVWKVAVRRQGVPVHEVMRPADEPSVIAAGAEFALRLNQFQQILLGRSDPMAGSESIFIGQIHSGEIYNQYPQECRLEGTRRWLPDVSREKVKAEFLTLLKEVEQKTSTTLETEFLFIRDAFRLDMNHLLVHAFQEGYQAVAGQPLAAGPKAFVDDGNTFWGLAQVPTVTHGPRAGGQHTVNEWVSIEDMERVVLLYVLVALAYCG